MKHALLIGNHPLRENIIKQYDALGYSIKIVNDFDATNIPKEFDELCVLPHNGTADHETLKALEAFSINLPQTQEGQAKPLCHLLLHDKVTLWLLQTLDLYPEIHKKLELYAFTMEDQWAKNVFCGLDRHLYPPLDREKIDEASNKTVHLVIAGISDLSESLAIHAALIAHFPNYVRNQALRTRITIVDKDITAHKDALIQRYINLFEHSYYRCVSLKKQQITQYHEPMYHASREDFVDVEWEFVDGDFFDPTLQHKLRLWSDDNNQLLSLALCDNNDNINFNRAFALPKNLYQNHVTVLVKTEHSGLLEKVHETSEYHNLYPIGMYDCGYDVRLPLLQMAKRLNYFYACSHGQEGTPTDMPTEKIESVWRNVQTLSMRYSNIYNVMTIATKMRSLGHEEKDWDRFFALTQDEIETVSAVEHNRWSVERLILGFRPPTDTEREEIRENLSLKEAYKKKKIHYDLCSYRELGIDTTGQDVRLYDHDLTACIPLIAQSFKESQP